MRPIKGASDTFFFICCRLIFWQFVKNAFKSATNFNHMFDALDTLFIKRLIVLLKKKKGTFEFFIALKYLGN